ncbi:MAG: DUF3800 domain-containing protein [Candidatus Corynebacterium faecigallinarum]
MGPTIDRMIYIDDSGRPQTGLAVYGWIEFPPDRWFAVLDRWLQTRRRLWRHYRIPVTRELHSTAYINGRGNVSAEIPDEFIHSGVSFKRDLGRAVAERCLSTLQSTEGLSVGSVFRKGSPDNFKETKQVLYRDLVAKFERELATTDSLGIIFMDGDGSDHRYRQVHRDLPLGQRKIIEDAIPVDSSISQLVQMADLVAWVANVTVDQHPKNAFAGSWYADYLSERDPNRMPIELNAPENS